MTAHRQRGRDPIHRKGLLAFARGKRKARKEQQRKRTQVQTTEKKEVRLPCLCFLD